VREIPAAPAGLVERLRAGEARAFEELVRAYQHRVFSVAFRMLGSGAEAEEVAQEVFVRVHRSIGTFRGDAALSTWLYAITSRVCLTRLASGERKVAREGEQALLRLADDRPDATATIEERERALALHRAIAELPEDRRVVVVLRDIEGLSYDDVAAALGLEVGTVKSRLHRARMELKERLEKLLP
jgi:RNA polymerase sigma-70 factor (ECF subfamily)